MKNYVGVCILAFLSLFTVNCFAGNPPSGTSLSFNGSDQCMKIASCPDLNIAATENFTVSCWVKVPKFAMSRILSKCNSGTNTDANKAAYELTLGSGYNGTICFGNSVNAMAVDPVNGGQLMNEWIGIKSTVDTWYHICMVIDRAANFGDGNILLYQDGVDSGKKMKDAFVLTDWKVENVYDVLLGCTHDGPSGLKQYFKGEIADVRFWKKALTPAEVVADMTAATPVATSLVAAYNFKNMTGATVPDISGKGHNGTLVNFPAQGGGTVETVATPIFSVAGGTYEQAQTVALTSATAEAKIYYTVDGSNPTASSTLYTAPIAVSTTTTIKAIAVKTGMTTSAVASATYTIGTVLVDYCKYDGAERTYTGDVNAKRVIRTITVNGATVAGTAQNFTISNPDQTNQYKVYVDKTADVLNATPGDELTFHFIKYGLEWMHFYAFVDYNQNHVFEEAKGELVSYSYYTDVAGAVEGVDSKGAKHGEIWCPAELPSFIIPANAKTGQTRVRFNVAWNDKNPCGYAKMGENRGSMIDFTINIAKSSTGIDNSSSSDIVAYVNGDGHLVVEGAEIGSSIEVYDIAGANIARASVQSNSEVLSSVQLSSASYLVKISDGTKSVVRRVIK